MGALVRYFFISFFLLVMTLINACSHLFDDDLSPSENSFDALSAQVVFAEAAKGPADVDLDKLKAQVYELLTDPAQAEVLAILKDASHDYFIHKLLLLPSVEQTSEIVKHWLAKTKQADKIIDKMGASQKPLAILASGNRAVAGDKLDYRQELIKDLIYYGDNAVLAELDDQEINVALTALLAKGDKALMKKALNGVNNTVKDQVLDWMASKYTQTIADSQDNLLDVFKDSLLKSELSKQMVVDAAQAGHINKLKLLYMVLVRNNASIVPLIAKMSGKNGVADRFSHFLAKLAPDADLVDIWKDYLNNVDDISTQVNLPGSSLSPFMLLNRHASSPEHGEIIRRMLPHVNEQSIASIAASDLGNFLSSVHDKSDLEQLKRVLKILLTRKNEHALIWSMSHRTKDKVMAAVRASGKISLKKIKKEVASNNTNWKKVLFYVQTLAIDNTTAKQIAEQEINVGGSISSIKLHLAIAKKSQTAESVSALRHYFSYLSTSELATIRNETDAFVFGKNALQIIAAKANCADQFEASALRLFTPMQAVDADLLADQEP